MIKKTAASFSFLLMAFMLVQCGNDPDVYSCETTGEVTCEPVSDKTPPSEALKKMRTDVVGTWRLYSTRSIDPAWKTDSTYSSVYLPKVPVVCLSSNGVLVDKNGRKGKECTYCYSIVSSPTSQDSFLIEVGDYGPMGCVPVFTSGQQIACSGDTLYIRSQEDRFIFHHKFTRMK